MVTRKCQRIVVINCISSLYFISKCVLGTTKPGGYRAPKLHDKCSPLTPCLQRGLVPHLPPQGGILFALEALTPNLITAYNGRNSESQAKTFPFISTNRCPCKFPSPNGKRGTCQTPGMVLCEINH